MSQWWWVGYGKTYWHAVVKAKSADDAIDKYLELIASGKHPTYENDEFIKSRARAKPVHDELVVVIE